MKTSVTMLLSKSIWITSRVLKSSLRFSFSRLILSRILKKSFFTFSSDVLKARFTFSSIGFYNASSILIHKLLSIVEFSFYIFSKELIFSFTLQPTKWTSIFKILLHLLKQHKPKPILVELVLKIDISTLIKLLIQGQKTILTTFFIEDDTTSF